MTVGCSERRNCRKLEVNSIEPVACRRGWLLPFLLQFLSVSPKHPKPNFREDDFFPRVIGGNNGHNTKEHASCPVRQNNGHNTKEMAQ